MRQRIKAPPSDRAAGDEEKRLIKESHRKDSKPQDPPLRFLGEQQLQKKSTESPISYHVTKWAILRLLALVYWVAFCAAFNQNRGLMGSHGLQPAVTYWDRVQEHTSDDGAWDRFEQFPSLFWWVPLNDTTMDGVAMVGLILSTLAIAGLYVSWASLFIMWLLQFTIVTMAQHTSFYQYGWESQVLETGFLAIFLCDLPSVSFQKSRVFLRPNSALWPTHQEPVSRIILWLFKWLCFRISIGAGLIKIRGSSCWTEKTCLWYHFETQPIPSPLSFVFHFLPRSILSSAVDLDLFVQLYTSWLVLLPTIGILRTIVRGSGLVQAGFMVNIMLSGNFSLLNHLTIVPALACLDDACWPKWLHRWILPPRILSTSNNQQATLDTPGSRFSFRFCVNSVFASIICYLSWPVVANLLQINSSGRQMMNASFDPFRLVNTYGAFGDVGRARYEPIVFVSSDGVSWTELEFPCKPGSLTRRPCFCAPYHYRIDWNIWFLGFPPHYNMLQQRESWLYILLEKILNDTPDQNERPWLNLLDSSSVRYLDSEQGKLRYTKVDMYHYQMAAPLWQILRDYWDRNEPTVWWKRSYQEPLIRPLVWDSGRLLAVAN